MSRIEFIVCVVVAAIIALVLILAWFGVWWTDLNDDDGGEW